MTNHNVLRVIKLIIFLAICSLLVMLYLAWTHEARASTCAAVDTVKDDIQTLMPHALLRELGGSEARAFMAGLNAVPPLTDYEADYIVIVQIPDKPGVAAIRFLHGCAEKAFVVPEALYRHLMESL